MGTSIRPQAGLNPGDRAHFVRSQFPEGGLLAGQNWRISPEPFFLPKNVVRELESLGRILTKFYRAVNLLYRRSVAGEEPGWVAQWLDQGKPAGLLELQRAAAFKNEVPRVIRPDLLLTDDGMAITELDSVPGAIGVTAWLNQTYDQIRGAQSDDPAPNNADATFDWEVLGGSEGMLRGFESIFDGAPNVHLVVSEESATYRPEMQWIARQLGPRFQVRDSNYTAFAPQDAVYRFFELFDLENVGNAEHIFQLALNRQVQLTPPPKPIFEEKMLFALLWNRNLRGFWRRELGESFFRTLLRLVPYTWLVNPEPLPPHGAIPEIDLTDWHQLKSLSQSERELILKVSGFAETAWGARGVYLGSDLPIPDWSAAVDLALREFERSPFVLQRYYKPRVVEARWFDFERNEMVPMPGRVRLCPFYFLAGQGDAARAHLGGVLATICPADKKIIHGMREAILAPCSYERT